MRLMLLIIVESKGSEGDGGEPKSDQIYFSEIRRRFYTNFSNDFEGEVTIQTIPLGGKQNYKDEKIQKRIQNEIAIGKSYGMHVVPIYLIDSDSIAKTFKEGSFFANLQSYCDNRGYELIWFCKNVENVFLGIEPNQINKIEEAKKFARANGIFSIPEQKLKKRQNEYGCSNALLVLDKYLIRKKEKEK